eukprot:scaffold61182_cov23-Cyclotella_meneghiniana.AAC.1
MGSMDKADKGNAVELPLYQWSHCFSDCIIWYLLSPRLYAIILALPNSAVGLSFTSHGNEANFNGKIFVVSWYLNATNAVFE